MSMENVNAIGKAIGYVAIAGSLLFSLMWCLPFTPDSLIRAFVIMFCLIWLAKIGLEITFLIEISQMQPTLKEDIEKLLIRTILKAGGFPGNNVTYEEFNKLPSLGKEVEGSIFTVHIPTIMPRSSDIFENIILNSNCGKLIVTGRHCVAYCYTEGRASKQSLTAAALRKLRTGTKLHLNYLHHAVRIKLIFGTALIIAVIIIMTMGDSKISEEVSLNNVNAVGLSIGCIAIGGSILFAVIFCLPCVPDLVSRIFLIVYCVVWVVKIILEIAFLIHISVIQSSVENSIEKFLIRTLLKAGGLEGKDMTYEKFDKLPPYGKDSGKVSCDANCMSYMKLMDSIQNKFGCCGIKKAEDWYKVAPNLPASCCEDRDCKIINKNACMSDLHHTIDSTFTGLFYATIIAIFVQVFCILFAFLLCKSMKSSKKGD
ncbi:hypothetical protein C0J52_14497 [Blattella germanica]|nr:hypothetical protein C0J52_14497 [Blattella germanica]